MKRIFDAVISLIGLIASSPILVPISIAVWLQDFHSPLYVADRTGMGGRPFRMIKLRSMVVNADKTGVDSTASGDPRVTGLGRFIRRYKLDELSQLWNVLLGDMSLVGPRPNVKRETDLYTKVEESLLSVRPGITDISSIVFADEGEILSESSDPDIDYNQLIRPWKSRLGLIYIANASLSLDVKLLLLTVLNSINRRKAIHAVGEILIDLHADPEVIRVARREDALVPSVPPGADGIVSERTVCES